MLKVNGCEILGIEEYSNAKDLRAILIEYRDTKELKEDLQQYNEAVPDVLIVNSKGKLLFMLDLALYENNTYSIEGIRKVEVGNPI